VAYADGKAKNYVGYHKYLFAAYVESCSCSTKYVRTEMPKFVDFGSDILPSHLLELSCSRDRPGKLIPIRSARHFYRSEENVTSRQPYGSAFRNKGRT
jgi:hypothetical protein